MAWHSFLGGLGAWLLRGLGAPRAPDMPMLPAVAVREASQREAPLAPAPVADRSPIVIGAGTTLAYASSVLRLATTGYRREYVDFLRELLERDGATKALVASRIITVAGGRLAITPAELPDGHKDTALAEEIADHCRQAVCALPDLRQRLADLGWGSFYGVAACEIEWTQRDGMWCPARLHRVANRRLSYPDSNSWDLYIYDSGITPGAKTSPGTVAPYGLNTTQYPGKFIVHTPSYAADYPTREGWGRELVWLMCFKSLGMRLGVQFVERFTRVLFWVSYTTSADGKPRAADEGDIDLAQSAMQNIGAGSLSGFVGPDSLKPDLLGPGTKGGKSSTEIIERWVNLCDAQAAKVVRGSTFTTEPGKNVGKGVGESGEKAESESERFDAQCLAETLRRDLVSWIVRLNWPNATHLIPSVQIHLDDPKPSAIVDLAAKAALAGIPVDADATGEDAGLKLIPNESGRPRRMWPAKPVEAGLAILGGDEAVRAEAEAQAAAEAEAAKTEALAKRGAAANDNPGEEGTEPDAEDDTDEPRAAAAE